MMRRGKIFSRNRPALTSIVGSNILIVGSNILIVGSNILIAASKCFFFSFSVISRLRLELELGLESQFFC